MGTFLPSMALGVFTGAAALLLHERGLGWLRALAFAWIGACFSACALLAGALSLSFPSGSAAMGLLGLGSLLGLCTLRTRRDSRAAPHSGETPVTPLQRLALVFVGALLLVGQYRISRHELAGDERLIWTAKARAIERSDSLGIELATCLRTMRQPTAAHHRDYPLILPLLLAFVGLDEEKRGPEPRPPLRWPVQGFDLALLFVLANLLFARGASRLAPLLLPAPFLTIWFWFPSAEADRMIALGLLLVCDALLHLRDPARRGSGLALLFGVLLLAAKNEGQLLFLASALSWVIAGAIGARPPHRSGRWILLSALPGMIAMGAHWAWKSAHGFHNDLIASEDVSLIAGLQPELLLHRLRELPAFLVRDWFLAFETAAFLPPLVLVLLLLAPGWWRRRRIALPLLLVTTATLGYLAVLMLTPYDFKWHWSTAAPRILGHLNPLLALIAAEAIGAGPEALSSDS